MSNTPRGVSGRRNVSKITFTIIEGNRVRTVCQILQEYSDGYMVAETSVIDPNRIKIFQFSYSEIVPHFESNELGHWICHREMNWEDGLDYTSDSKV